jgi:hypothetical protein
VKRNVKIDPYIGKIKWFADFVLALMTTCPMATKD